MVPVAQIVDDRLARWAIRMKESHATPVMLVGIGHDHVSGQIVLCTLDEEEFDIEKLKAFLRYALAELG
jgi:hypothetical protein